jgi:hypothetical protein
MMEGSEILKNAELRREGTGFLPWIRKYYSIEEMSRLEKPQPSLEDVQSRERSSFNQGAPPQPLLDDMPPQPQLPFDLVPSQPQPHLNLVPEGESPKGMLLLMSDYIRLIKNYKERHRRTFYKDLHSGQLPFPVRVLCRGKRRFYFVEITDPKLIKEVESHKMREKIMKQIEKIIYIHIKVPERISKAVNLISSPEFPDYRQFYEFINQAPAEILPIRLSFCPIKYVERRIRIREEDYKKVLKIAEANDLSLSKVIATLLESYIISNYKTRFRES